MKRNRDVSRWPQRFNYSNEKAFLRSNLESGLHSIAVKQQFLDLLIEDRKSKTTIISFHASLTKRVRTVPALQGHGLAEDTGVNLIALADPTIGLGDIDLAWFLGNRGIGKLPALLSPLIQHAVNALETERLIIFGPSGGGYASILFGKYFPGSIILAVNPRLDLKSKPAADIGNYLTVGHWAHGATPRLRIRDEYVVDLLSEYSDELNFDLCIYQNLGDSVYLQNQLIPFVSSMHYHSNLYTRIEWTGKGHTPIPGKTLRSIIASMANASSQAEAISSAGFTPTAIH